LKFAKSIRVFARVFPKDFVAYEDIKQLVRSSGSVGANYIEANNSLSKKTFLCELKFARKKQKKAITGSNSLKPQMNKQKKSE